MAHACAKLTLPGARRAGAHRQRIELVAAAIEFIIAYDPLTGKELWRHKGLDEQRRAQRRLSLTIW